MKQQPQPLIYMKHIRAKYNKDQLWLVVTLKKYSVEYFVLFNTHFLKAEPFEGIDSGSSPLLFFFGG